MFPEKCPRRETVRRDHGRALDARIERIADHVPAAMQRYAVCPVR